MLLLAEADSMIQLWTTIIGAVGGIIAGAITTGLPIWLTWKQKYKEEQERLREEQDKHKKDLANASRKERELNEALEILNLRLVKMKTNDEQKVQQEQDKHKKDLADASRKERELKEALEKYKKDLAEARKQEGELKAALAAKEKELENTKTIDLQLIQQGEGMSPDQIPSILSTLRGLTDQVEKLWTTVNALQQRVEALEDDPDDDVDEDDDGTLPTPWPSAPPSEGKAVWLRGRVYRFVKFGGKNSRIETLNGAVDPLKELKDERGRISNTGTIPNYRLFNDRHGKRPITSADHP
jgi:F0F1-type ATP synthase membrane subunit b/b'